MVAKRTAAPASKAVRLRWLHALLELRLASGSDPTAGLPRRALAPKAPALSPCVGDVIEILPSSG
jgi:hypothetical protein